MLFSCKTSDLLQGLHLVSRAIGTQQALPILENVLISTEGKRCTLSSTNLEMSIVTSFEADIKNEGTLTLPAKALLNFVQYNSDDVINLERIEGTQCRCSSTHANAVLLGEEVDEYPKISFVERETSFSVSEQDLLEALNLVTFSSAKATVRPVLSGVFIRSEKKELILVATDSYRLSEFRLPLKEELKGVSCIIPAKVLDEIRSVLRPQKQGNNEKKEKKEKSRDVECILNTQQAEIRVGNTRFITRLIDGKFPDYQQIIPHECKVKTPFSTKELMTAAKRMHYFARETNNTLTFQIEKNNVRITTPQTQIGKDETNLSINVDGEGKIALSSSYLLDFLGHLSQQEVTMEIVDHMHPAVFRLPENENFLHLIMPLRLQEEVHIELKKASTVAA